MNGNAADSSTRLTRRRSRSNEDLIEFTRDGAVNLSRLSMQLIAGRTGKNTLTKKAELCASSLARLAHTDIQQVSFRVAKLVLPVATASKQVHDDLILGFDVRGLGSQILRVVLR